MVLYNGWKMAHVVQNNYFQFFLENPGANPRIKIFDLIDCVVAAWVSGLDGWQGQIQNFSEEGVHIVFFFFSEYQLS